ncbi:MAG TPA: BON domain-containing protein, partial [Longimicrobiaceae bacterium]|nr:BON domain-containing protein [Longimicrobiaceae bacterium]
MARYDGGWSGPRRPSRYDEFFRPYGPPDPVMRPGGAGRAGFNPMVGPVSPGYGRDYGQERGGRSEPWGDVGAGGMGEREEFWEPGTVYGPARYGLGPYHERLRRHRRSDDELREEVEEALFYDTWVDADAITVEVKDGIVTLQGELPDFDEIRYATDDAWDVDGVRGVRSQLTVRQGERGGGSQGGSQARGTAGRGGAA